MSDLLVVFVHGYSVTNFETYGELPLRIRNEAIARGYNVQIEDVFLGRYITFHDEVLLADVARAMEHAVRTQLPPGKRFVCITHSTGGPLVRTWWRNNYQLPGKTCPLSHLIMLAPANHGSALAQLGKSKLSRVKNWIDGLEPGQGILNWLELGSAEAWQLNYQWITTAAKAMTDTGVFPFVITGQDIDRKLYDHINSYTGETGSDGVVRVASANLNSSYLKLAQLQSDSPSAPGDQLSVVENTTAPGIPMKVLKYTSHSGNDMGIMRRVKKELGSPQGLELVQGIFDCLKVATNKDFQKLVSQFANETQNNQELLRIEKTENSFGKKIYIHDRQSMVIFRVKDDQGNEVSDFDLVLTGDNGDPDQLPSGFFTDRQCNLAHRNTLTYFFNYDLMCGAPELRDADGSLLRPATIGLKQMGIILKARPEKGFIRYKQCRISGTQDLLKQVIRPNSTTLVDIILKRLVDPENFRFEKNATDEVNQFSFKDVQAGDDFIA